MIGRGAYGRPWLLGQVMAALRGEVSRPDPGIDEQYDIITLHYRAMLDHYGEMRSEEHTSELQSLMRISYAVFCLKQKIRRPYSLPHTRTHYNSPPHPRQQLYSTNLL